MTKHGLESPSVGALHAETGATPHKEPVFRAMVEDFQQINLSEPSRAPLMGPQETMGQYGLEGQLLAKLELPYRQNRVATEEEISSVREARTLLIIDRPGMSPVVGSQSAFERLAATPSDSRYWTLESEPDIRVVDKGEVLSIGRHGWLPESVRAEEQQRGLPTISRHQVEVYVDDDGSVHARALATKNEVLLAASFTDDELQRREVSTREARAYGEKLFSNILTRVVPHQHQGRHRA